MENLLKYYEFSDFIKDTSGYFKNPMCFAELNSQHFLIFEKDQQSYHLYVAKYANRAAVGKRQPEIAEVLQHHYDKSQPEHRILLRQYLE